MDIELACADARQVDCDLQVVKHFCDLFGGAEAAINKATGGLLRRQLHHVDSLAPPDGVLLRADSGIGSRRLFYVNLGYLDSFGLAGVERYAKAALDVAGVHGFDCLALPVVGISDHVGLPIASAFKTLLCTVLTYQWQRAAPLTTVDTPSRIMIFDDDSHKIRFFLDLFPSIVDELGVSYERLSDDRFRIQPIKSNDSDEPVEIHSTHKEEPTTQIHLPPVHEEAVNRILFLSANTSDQSILDLDREIRDIDRAIQAEEYRSLFELRKHPAAHIFDLQELMLRHRPAIVHFSGHGSPSGSIVLRSTSGSGDPVSAASLGGLFRVFRAHVRCVVLNACYSDSQADAIVEHIDFVVGMGGAVDDESAIAFSSSFYQALAYGLPVDQAFELGRVQIDLASLPDSEVPKLRVREGVVSPLSLGGGSR